MTVIACLSPYTENQVRELSGTDQIEVRLAPDPPACEVVRAMVADAAVVIGDGRHLHHLDRCAVSGMRCCRLIQAPAVGFDEIDVQAAAEFGIPVANSGGHNSGAVADWVIMAMLNLLRHGPAQDRDMHQGSWALMQGRELGAMTVGIVGMGKIGRALVARLRGFGSALVYTDILAADGVTGADQVTLPELLGRADIVTIHAPLNDDTRHMIGAAELAAMRSGALLVNASRGPIVDERALVAALRSGHLSGAALDVYETEPLLPDSPLRSIDSVFLSPHAAAATTESAARLHTVIGANIRRVLAGEPPLYVISPRQTGGRNAI